MTCLLGPADAHLGWWSHQSAAGLIITVTNGGGEVIEREAGCATGPGPVAHDPMVVDHSVRLRRPQASMVLI